MRMTNAKRCHPERSEAESKDLMNYSLVFASGFLDFARNDAGSIDHSSFVIHHSNLLRAEVRL